MAKIGLFDIARGKTTKEIVKWFTAKGHEVRDAMGADPEIVKWSDVTLFEWIDHNLEAYTLSNDPPNEQWPLGDVPWIEARAMKKKIVTRGMDIEIYAGHFRSIDWNEVSRLIYPADHIWELMNDGSVDWNKYPHLNPEKITLSVDMNEWTFKDRSRDIWDKSEVNIAFMGDMWWAKAPEMMLQVLAEAQRRSGKKIVGHVRGDWHYGTDAWFIKYRDNMIKKLNLDVRFYDWVDTLDGWLDQMDFFVTTNMKDAFSLIVAQAAAKGIPTFPHNFWGAEGLYPKKWVWSTVDELINKMFLFANKSEDYRQFINDNYSNEKVMPKWESVLLG